MKITDFVKLLKIVENVHYYFHKIVWNCVGEWMDGWT
jgi:hypothetical protein